MDDKLPKNLFFAAVVILGGVATFISVIEYLDNREDRKRQRRISAMQEELTAVDYKDRFDKDWTPQREERFLAALSQKIIKGLNGAE